jgi:ATP-dependent DNA ligase
VVVGFAPEGSVGLAKLRVARHDDDKLVYVSRVGTGWDRKKAATIRKALAPARANVSVRADANIDNRRVSTSGRC